MFVSSAGTPSQLTSRRPPGCCPGADRLLGSPSSARNAATSASMAPLERTTVGVSETPPPSRMEPDDLNPARSGAVGNCRLQPTTRDAITAVDRAVDRAIERKLALIARPPLGALARLERRGSCGTLADERPNPNGLPKESSKPNHPTCSVAPTRCLFLLNRPAAVSSRAGPTAG